MIRPLLLVSLLILGCSADYQDSSAYSYTLTDGSVLDLESPEKLILINYWAIWCAPCRKEVPELNELMHEHSDKLQIVGINFDDIQGDKLMADITRLGIEFPNLLRATDQPDPRQIWNLPPIAVLPETLIIDTQGNLQQRLIGPQDKASLEALLQL